MPVLLNCLLCFTEMYLKSCCLSAHFNQAKILLQWRNPVAENNHCVVLMDASLSARPSSSALPPHHSTPLKKAFSEQKCRVDTMTQLHRGSHCLFHTIYIVLFCGFRHELGSQSAHSFQDWFLKSRSRPPPTLEDLSKEWLSKIFRILFHKLFLLY